MLLSSRKAIHARWRLAFFYLRPGLFLPLSDLCIIAFLRSLGRSLQTPPHLSENLPDVTRVIVDTSQAADQLCNSLERPQICRISMGNSATKKLLLDQSQLLGQQAGLPPRQSCTVQHFVVAAAPGDPPFADALSTNPQDLSNRCLPLNLLEQRDGLLAPFTQLLKSLDSPLHEGIITKTFLFVRCQGS